MIVEPGMVVLLNGDLAEVVGVINDPAAVIRVVGEEPCGCCGSLAKEATIVIGSHLWGEAVKPVETLGDGSLLVAAMAAHQAMLSGEPGSAVVLQAASRLRAAIEAAGGFALAPKSEEGSG